MRHRNRASRCLHAGFPLVSQLPTPDVSTPTPKRQEAVSGGAGAFFGTALLLFAQRLPDEDATKPYLTLAAPTLGVLIATIGRRIVVFADEAIQHWWYERNYREAVAEKQRALQSLVGNQRERAEIERSLRDIRREHEEYWERRVRRERERNRFFGP